MPKLKVIVLAGGITLATIVGGFVLYSKASPVEVEDSGIIEVKVKDIQTPHGPVPEGWPAEPVEHLDRALIGLGKELEAAKLEKK